MINSIAMWEQVVRVVDTRHNRLLTIAQVKIEFGKPQNGL